MYKLVQAWVRVLHRCNSEEQFEHVLSLFVDWLNARNETEFRDYWVSTWLTKLFSLWCTGFMFADTQQRYVGIASLARVQLVQHIVSPHRLRAHA